MPDDLPLPAQVVAAGVDVVVLGIVVRVTVLEVRECEAGAASSGLESGARRLVRHTSLAAAAFEQRPPVVVAAPTVGKHTRSSGEGGV